MGLVRSLVPAPIADRIDWTTLALEPGSFVDESSSRHADLLFSVHTVDDHQPVLLYVLTEAQSSPAPLMALRMAGYVARVLERYAESNGYAQPLPVVLPLVVSHCERPWSAALTLRELYGVPSGGEEVDPYLLGIRYIVDDLSGQTEETIRRRVLTARAMVTLLMLRHVRVGRAFAEAFARWADLLRALSPAELAPVVVYALQVGEEPPEALRDVLQSYVSQQAGDMAMTTAERLMQEGEARGEMRGVAKGMAKMLVGQLLLKFGAVSEADQQRIANAGTDTLELWARRVLTVQTLAEVFAEGDEKA